ncbi:MAG: MBL fold metallo-hydrolase [Chitinophagaceae bacterium]|nr:MBL fold metallo-hydrolase [Chitinophagaceae bacterium]
MSLKITGQLPAGKYKERIEQSPHYKNGAFQNLSPTPMKPEGLSYWKMMRTFFKKHPDTAPPKPVPFFKTDLQQLKAEDPLLVWFGHSSYLLRINGKNFLIDPVFSGNAAPLSFMVKAFPGANAYHPADMPEIDYLILTHDHYDHLDYQTILRLKKKIRSVVCSLGIGAHLRYWGIDPDIISEMDWWQQLRLDNELELTAAPARHFSGRGLKRGQSLWSSFILQSKQHSVYLGGDSGYDTHFKEIGDRYGPFDLAILEAGQYNVMWPLIHMMPEQTVQAALDLRAKALLPVHWGKFRLSTHPWNEPVKRVLLHAGEAGLPVHTPRIGELLQLNGEIQTGNWWEMG